MEHRHRGALVTLMSPPTTVVADDYRYTVTANMSRKPAITTNHVTERATYHFHRWQVWLGALAGHVAGYVADVANRVIRAVPGKVTGFAAVVACLVIGAICGQVARLVTVVAEPYIVRGKTWVRAIASQVTHISTHVADWIIVAFVREMTWFLTVPTRGCWGALRSNVTKRKTKILQIWDLATVCQLRSKDTAGAQIWHDKLTRSFPKTRTQLRWEYIWLQTCKYIVKHVYGYKYTNWPSVYIPTNMKNLDRHDAQKNLKN